MYNYKLHDYVPVPEPATSNLDICCHYYPGWKKGGNVAHNGFYDLHDYPERTPLWGYYDESSPEVFDWQIKWALEHGINCFIHCWYRNRENIGNPVTVEDLRLGHAIHEAFFNARYKDMMKFAIMWECVWGKAQDKNDLINNLLPFWVEQYFSKPNYLKIDGKPVLFVYNLKEMMKAIGGFDPAKEAFDALREEIKKYGFDGIHITANHQATKVDLTNQWWDSLDTYKKMGMDSNFQYGWSIAIEDLTDAEYENYLKRGGYVPSDFALKFFENQIDMRVKYDPDYTMYVASSMLDSEPWFKVFGKSEKGPTLRYIFSIPEYVEHLKYVKKTIDSLPETSVGKNILVLDNWNEWSEGHYIAPSLEHGFKKLQAIREIFTNRDNLPDYRMPETLGFGMYDEMWK